MHVECEVVYRMKQNIAFNPLDYPLYLMAKPTGAVCNLNCAYCYYTGKESLYPNRKHYRMSDELLEKYVETYILSQPTPNVLFTWHGGEALLRDVSFYRKAVLLQKKYGRGRHIENSLQTNGVLLNDEWCRFFKENDFLIGISIDGPEDCHDIYRKNRGNAGTFRQVMRGIELLHKHGVAFNTLGVIHNYNAKRPLEVYHFLKSIGSHYMQFSPIVERLSPTGRLLSPSACEEGERLGEWNVSPDDFGRFYTTIFDEWVLFDVSNYYVQLFDATLANWVGEAPGVCIYAKECGHAAVMEFNGDIYSCDHFVFPEYKLGNLRGNAGFIEMILSEKQQRFGRQKHEALPTQCCECGYLRLCNGECPKNRIVKDRNGEPGLNYLCEGYRHYFEHVSPYMSFMASELQQNRPPANVMKWARGEY